MLELTKIGGQSCKYAEKSSTAFFVVSMWLILDLIGTDQLSLATGSQILNVSIKNA